MWSGREKLGWPTSNNNRKKKTPSASDANNFPSIYDSAKSEDLQPHRAGKRDLLSQKTTLVPSLAV